VISRTSRMARFSWSVAYLCFLLAGIVAFFSPSQIVERTLIEILVYLWAMFLTIGGGLCFGGKLRGNWAGELIGLLPLSAANYVFGTVLLTSGSSSAAFAIGGMFCGVGTAFVGRWLELKRLARENQGVNNATD
jgi:hypothetical protein